jgi:hypothetical protein
MWPRRRNGSDDSKGCSADTDFARFSEIRRVDPLK